MRLLLCGLLSFGLLAQQSAIPPAQARNIISESFLRKDAIRKSLAALPRQKLMALQEPKLCAIPLLNATPQVQGTMRQITPAEVEFNMPKLMMPAPACK